MPRFLTAADAAEPDGNYVVSITRLKVRSPRTAFSFFRRFGRVQSQLRNSPGLVSFGLRAQLLRMTFSTYGVFEDRKAMVEFVGSAAHGDAMRSLRGQFHQVESRTVAMSGGELPANWAAICALLVAAPASISANDL